MTFESVEQAVRLSITNFAESPKDSATALRLDAAATSIMRLVVLNQTVVAAHVLAPDPTPVAQPQKV